MHSSLEQLSNKVHSSQVDVKLSQFAPGLPLGDDGVPGEAEATGEPGGDPAVTA